MSNQKGKHEECARKSEVDKRIEEIRAELEEVLERLGQIEVGETWITTGRTRK
jgi:predicted nuclease with TOPRIM domain